MICPSCTAENRPGARFCLGCGTALTRACPNGHPVTAGARFCDECGAAVDAATAAAGSPSHPPTAPAPAAERRLVSVAGPLLGQAREVFELLAASPWLARVAAAAGTSRARVPA